MPEALIPLQSMRMSPMMQSQHFTVRFIFMISTMTPSQHISAKSYGKTLNTWDAVAPQPESKYHSFLLNYELFIVPDILNQQ